MSRETRTTGEQRAEERITHNLTEGRADLAKKPQLNYSLALVLISTRRHLICNVNSKPDPRQLDESSQQVARTRRSLPCPPNGI